jgi:hypothetical protein
VTVATNALTTFETDGEIYAGRDGITALAGLPTGSLVAALGVLDVRDRSFTASAVHAGDSIGGDALTAIHGNVVARTGNLLKVKGAIAVRPDRPAHFHRSVVVEVGADTRVVRASDLSGTYDAGDVSVGQRIVAFGELTNPDVAPDPLGPDVALTLDATAGRVRLLPTRLHGTVTGVLPGQINVALRGIDRLGIDMFDFAGTGKSALTDADPTDYEIETATLPLDAIAVDDPVRVIGFVNRFGSAPPDFDGRTLIGPHALRAALGVGWTRPGSTAPFQAMGPASVVVDLTNPDIGLRHHMLIGPIPFDLFDLPASPAIEPAATAGIYGITEPGRVELFVDFTDFVDELALRLGGGDRARALAAYGLFDEPANALTANRVFVHLLPPE